MRHDGTPPAEADGLTWVFGYGSLIWRPAFPYSERRTGVVTGWARRFWQGSPDHRGVPEAPGRVVTLVPDAASECWGVAYAVTRETAATTFAALDHREAGGYSRLSLDVSCDDGTLLTGVSTYVATASNPWYLGEASLEAIARQVTRSRGPSGDNREYVQRLAEVLRTHEVEDEHVYALEARLRALS